MLNYKKIFIHLVGLSLLFFLEARGQVAKSPFSYVGIGEYYGSALAHNQGMAGVGVSNPQYYYLNNMNPALLVFNRATVFEAGLIGERRTVKGNGASETNSNGNLNYLIMGFPVLYNKWSTSIGLAPYSAVNYRLNYIDNIEGSTSTVNVTEIGSGGINQLFWSNGVSLHKNLSIGAKATYLFSSIVSEYSNALSQSSQPIAYSPTLYERTYVKDFNFSVGVSYHKDSVFRKNYNFNVGLVYDFKSELNTQYLMRVERRSLSGIVDSTTLVNNQPGTITLPQAISGGISFGKGVKWTTGIDYTYLDYSQFRDNKGSSQGATPGWRLAWGAEFTPDPSALGSYLKRMTYRTGISYDKFPYLINGMPVKDFGINFGFSLPAGRFSSLDFALKVGKRGNLKDNTIEENYFKIYFGVTFNDQWFIRRRFD
ncbi:MAG: hypothetical protein JNM78_10235 [Cyclobacteriaceae bacterium]|nr:hypothetical protein [Cyclobacteriaceae bacterium]